jgi:hypothetical protein
MNTRLVTAACILLTVINTPSSQGGANYRWPYATAWIQQFGTDGDDMCLGLAIDRADNIVVTGVMRSAFSLSNTGAADAFVARYDPNGTCLWYEPIGSDQADQGGAVALDAAGNIYITGFTLGLLGEQSYGRQDMFLAKYDPNGTRLWIRQAGTDQHDVGMDVATGDNGEVYVTGYTMGCLGERNQGGYDIFLAKYDSGGQLIWIRQFGTTNSEWPNSDCAIVDDAGNVYLALSSSGRFVEGRPGPGKLYLAKYDTNGNQCWIQQWGAGAPYSENPRGITFDPNGDIFVAVETTCAPVNPGRYDALFAKFDPNGTLLWTEQLGTGMDDSAEFIGVDPNRGILVVGSTDGDLGGKNAGGSSETSDIFVAIYDLQGKQLDVCQFGTRGNDQPLDGTLDSHGNLLIAGWTTGSLTETPGQREDCFLMKLTP